MFMAVPDVHGGEFLLFPSVTGTHLYGETHDAEPRDIVPALSLFYTGDYAQMRLLAEYSASPDTHELERLQLGWRPDPQATVWLGRFHSPVGYWTTEFHHGDYLVTSISAPQVAYDDEGGPFPSHLVRLLIEGDTRHGVAGISYAAGVGIGPVLEDRLMPQDILDPNNHKGKLTAAAKVAYRPRIEDQDQLGVFVGYADIPVMGQPGHEVTQRLVGAHMNLETNRARLIGEVYLADTHLEGVSAPESSRFASAYLHGEFQLRSAWTLFGRVENTFCAPGDHYLNLMPLFVRSRFVTGARYDITPSQAVKVELSRNRRQDDSLNTLLQIQWSMVIR